MFIKYNIKLNSNKKTGGNILTVGATVCANSKGAKSNLSHS